MLTCRPTFPGQQRHKDQLRPSGTPTPSPRGPGPLRGSSWRPPSRRSPRPCCAQTLSRSPIWECVVWVTRALETGAHAGHWGFWDISTMCELRLKNTKKKKSEQRWESTNERVPQSPRDRLERAEHGHPLGPAHVPFESRGSQNMVLPAAPTAENWPARQTLRPTGSPGSEAGARPCG